MQIKNKDGQNVVVKRDLTHVHDEFCTQTYLFSSQRVICQLDFSESTFTKSLPCIQNNNL